MPGSLHTLKALPKALDYLSRYCSAMPGVVVPPAAEGMPALGPLPTEVHSRARVSLAKCGVHSAAIAEVA